MTKAVKTPAVQTTRPTTSIVKGASVTRTGTTYTSAGGKPAPTTRAASTKTPPSLQPQNIKTPQVLRSTSGGVTTQAQTAAKHAVLQQMQTEQYPRSPTTNKIIAPMNASVETAPVSSEPAVTPPLLQSLIDTFGPMLAQKLTAPPTGAAPAEAIPPSEAMKAVATSEGVPAGSIGPAQEPGWKPGMGGVPTWMLFAGGAALLFMMLQGRRK